MSEYKPIDPTKEEECDCDPMYAHRCHKCGGRGWVPTQEAAINDESRILVDSSKRVEQFEVTIDWKHRTVYVTDAKGTTFTMGHLQ